MSPKPRVLLLSTQPCQGGIGRVMDIQATALADRGYDVAFAYFVRADIPVSFRSDEDRDEIHYLDEIGRNRSRSSVGRLWSRVKTLRSIVANGGFDAVIAHNEGSAFVSAGLIGVARTVAVLHLSITHATKNLGKVRQRLHRARLALAVRLNSRTVVVSEAIARQARALLKFQRPVVIENCCDVPLPHPADADATDGGPPGRVRLVAIARLAEEKNLVSLVRIAAKLKAAGRAVQLVLVGEGDAKELIREEVKRAGFTLLDLSERECGADASAAISEEVVLTGFVRDPHAWLDGADLLVMPSFAEGYPLAMVEALATGVPICAADCPTGPREIFGLPPRDLEDGELDEMVVVPHRGFLLPIPDGANTDQLWVNALLSYAASPDLRDTVRVVVMRERERFGVRRFADEWIEVLSS